MPNQRAPGITPRTIAIPDDMWKRTQRLAWLRCTTPSDVIRKALEDLLEAGGVVDDDE